MVGSPKRLADLARIEASLAVRCRACGRRRVFDVALLGRRLVNECRNSSWDELPRAIPCRCGSIDLALAPVPFADGVVDPEMGRYQRAVVRAAVDVLRAHEQGVAPALRGVDGVRLALRVLLPWVAAERLTAFWHGAAEADPDRRAAALTRAFAPIELELRMLGRLDPA